MTSRPLCQPIITPEKRLAAERERNRRFWEAKSYIPKDLRVTNATMPTDAPWALFTPPAREDGEDHRRYPSRFGERSVFLHEWGAGLEVEK